MNENDSNGYTLLLVDDEPNIIRSLKRLLRSEPIAILTASNGREAMEIFQNQSIQVLLTDNIMPEMTGIELIKKVKACSPQTVRIILSGHSDMDAVLSAINEGEAYRFIMKPWNDLDIKATVALAFAHYKLVEDNARMHNELEEKSRLLDEVKSRHPEIFDSDQIDCSKDLSTGEGVAK